MRIHRKSSMWSGVDLGKTTPYGSADKDMIRKNSRAGYGHTPFNDNETSWMKLARCVGYDTEEFFPAGVEDSRIACEVDQTLKQVCGRCVVSRECLEFALKHEMVGVWGGSNDYTRHQLKKTNTKIVCPGCRNSDIFKEYDGSSICSSCGLSWIA